jgi:Fic family protein/plasmid maintenance system antidote protein VapI
MKTLLKNARLEKGLMVRELAQSLGVDQALISKFEGGTRKPTREQLPQLAQILGIDVKELKIQWLKEKVLYELGEDEFALEALQFAEQELRLHLPKKSKVVYPKSLSAVLASIDKLQKKLAAIRKFDSYRIAQALELEYTFESNRIEGNTLTLKETDLVINEGLTISGKSMREHLEAINHKDAIVYMKQLAEKGALLLNRELLGIHQLVLRGIDEVNAGKYRSLQVMIKGSKHIPPPPYLVSKHMEDYFIWYQENHKRTHPVVLAAEMHERLVTIHPFIDGNGRTSRLVMNLILLQHGYVIANIKGDSKSRLAYYNALEAAQTTGDKNAFILLVAQYELAALERYLKVLQG